MFKSRLEHKKRGACEGSPFGLGWLCVFVLEIQLQTEL
jgi:hypothetical protein